MGLGHPIPSHRGHAFHTLVLHCLKGAFSNTIELLYKKKKNVYMNENIHTQSYVLISREINLINHRGPSECHPKPMKGFGTGDQVSPWNRWLLCHTGSHEQHTALFPAHNLFILTLIKRAIVAFLNCVRIAFSTATVAIMEAVSAFNSGHFSLFFFTAQVKIN